MGSLRSLNPDSCLALGVDGFLPFPEMVSVAFIKVHCVSLASGLTHSGPPQGESRRRELLGKSHAELVGHTAASCAPSLQVPALGTQPQVSCCCCYSKTTAVSLEELCPQCCCFPGVAALPAWLRSRHGNVTCVAEKLRHSHPSKATVFSRCTHSGNRALELGVVSSAPTCAVKGPHEVAGGKAMLPSNCLCHCHLQASHCDFAAPFFAKEGISSTLSRWV